MRRRSDSVSKIKYIVSIIAAAIISTSIIITITSCGVDIDVGKAKKVLTSFSVDWPADFNGTCRSNEPMDVVIYALDQNMKVFSWSGTVSIGLDNALVSVSPPTVNLTNGSVARPIAFTNDTENWLL